MPIAKPSPLFAAVRGRLHSMVFRSGTAGLILSTSPTADNPPRPGSRSMRAAIASLSRAWPTLSPATRAAWRDWAQTLEAHFAPGLSADRLAYLAFIAAGTANPDNPAAVPPLPTIPGLRRTPSLSFATDSYQQLFAFLPFPLEEDELLFITLSQPTPPTRRRPSPLLLRYTTANAQIYPSPIFLASRQDRPAPGWWTRIAWRAYHPNQPLAPTLDARQPLP